MGIKVLFVLISYLITFVCIWAIYNFKPKKYSLIKSVFISAFFYSLSAIVDFALFLIIVIAFLPQGDYGTGIELLVAFINCIIFIPIYVILGRKTYRKFKDIYPQRTDIKAFKSLWKTVIVKAVFLIAATIWIVEVV